MAGVGPAPFAATLLADMGAGVIRIDRREAADLGLPAGEAKFEVLYRGRRSLAVDVKADEGRAAGVSCCARRFLSTWMLDIDHGTGLKQVSFDENLLSTGPGFEPRRVR